MSQDNLDGLLTGFRDDINSGDLSSAQDKYEDILNLYSGTQDEEAELAFRYRASDSESIASGDRESADDYFRSFLGASGNRTRFKLFATLILARYEELQDSGEFNTVKSELDDVVDKLVNAEDKINRTKSKAESVLENANIPPKVIALSPSLLGGSAVVGEGVEIEFSVNSVGDSTATNVDISIDSTSGIQPSQTTDKVGLLASNNKYTETYEFDILEGADDAETVSFVVESDNAGRDTSEIVIPVDARSDGSDPPSDFPGSDELFDLIDKDGDGEITPAEMSQAVGEFLQNGTVEGNNVSPGEMSQVVGWFLSQ